MHGRKDLTIFPERVEPLLLAMNEEGKNARQLPAPFDVYPLDDIDKDILNEDLPGLPDVSEVETVRHFTRLSRLNYGIDNGIYPLGSCTMKYNPKICEEIAGSVKDIHPADTYAMTNVLKILIELSKDLEEICGMDASTLWGAAGAHGELIGMLIIKKALEEKGEPRSTVLIPDTAHGTNPASSTIAGFSPVQIPSGPRGYLEASTIKDYLDDDVAALMITNPNTLGIFEQEIAHIAELLHNNGSYLYMDGANLNAILGTSRPGDMGVDCMHLNLHKTFASPHGGGGPGSGPVLVKRHLMPYLPLPWIVADEKDSYTLKWDSPTSIGTIHSGMGNLAVLIKTLAYILSLGPEGIKDVSHVATLNANYIKTRLSKSFDIPYTTPTLHEFVLTDKRQQANGVTTMDIAKALIGFGIHPPTIYFPLVVNNAIMIEPTETEPLEELKRFADVMETIASLAETSPEIFKDMPSVSPVGRVDEVWAARHLILTWDMGESNKEAAVSKQ